MKIFKDRHFVGFITKYDLVCLQETWPSKKSKIDIDGFSSPIHSFRKVQSRRARRNSGWIIIYIKDINRKGVKLVKNDIDCIVWIKLDKTYFKVEDDWYLAITYIPPENSVYHNVYDVDIFKKLKLEDELSYYKCKEKVALLGDLNSRIGKKCDFIENNYDINLEFNYTQNDIQLETLWIVFQTDSVNIY